MVTVLCLGKIYPLSEILNPFVIKELIDMKIRKVKKSSLVIGFLAALIVSIFLGITGGAMGFGSRYPQFNLITAPFLCPGRQMSYTQHVTEIGTATYWTATWFCEDEGSDIKTELDSDTVFMYASPFYSLVFLVLLLVIVYVYWNSSVGPAKSDGLHLW
jgi:hypothetical protein